MTEAKGKRYISFSNVNLRWRSSVAGPSADMLTSSGPPLDGADGGTVQDELLRCRVVRGRGLQASEVSAWRQTRESEPTEPSVPPSHRSAAPEKTKQSLEFTSYCNTLLTETLRHVGYIRLVESCAQMCGEIVQLLTGPDAGLLF